MHADTHASHTCVHPYANLHTHQQHGHTHAIYKAISKSKPNWPDLQSVRYIYIYILDAFQLQVRNRVENQTKKQTNKRIQRN